MVEQVLVPVAHVFRGETPQPHRHDPHVQKDHLRPRVEGDIQTQSAFGFGFEPPAASLAEVFTGGGLWWGGARICERRGDGVAALPTAFLIKLFGAAVGDVRLRGGSEGWVVAELRGEVGDGTGGRRAGCVELLGRGWSGRCCCLRRSFGSRVRAGMG